ncbi:MAG TPA: hypothetical protein VGU64_06340 [Terriglobales bacterium]|nr:hypothetical protein [Terriglobales bacterium]
MNRKSFKPALAIVFGLIIVLNAFAQTTRTRPTASPDVSFLPASDGVVLIDVHRLLSETLPRVFAADSAKLSQVNAEIDKFKTETGVDARALTRVVVGTRYTYPSPNVTKLESVAVAHGTFDPKAIATAGRAKAQGRYREEQYHGMTIMIFTINDPMRLLGLWNLKVSDLAVSAVDAKTLVIGSVTNVRAAIDAGRSGSPANSDLLLLANRDPNAVIGFGANVTRNLTANLNVGTDTIAADINSIRQVYGSVGSTQTDVSLLLVARTDSPTSAKNLSDMATGLKQLGAIFIVRMAEPRKALALAVLDNLKITTRENELEIRTQFAAAALASLMK